MTVKDFCDYGVRRRAPILWIPHSNVHLLSDYANRLIFKTSSYHRKFRLFNSSYMASAVG